MSLTSVEYFTFLVVVVTAFWTVPVRYRRHLLLVASWTFYATYGLAPFAALLFDTAVVAVVTPRIRATEGRAQRLWVAVGVSLPLALLVADKALPGGAPSPIPDLGGSAGGFFAAVGISFFTFHVISYVVDCAAGRLPAQQSLLDLAVYIAFFPHVLAGPIMRARRLVPLLHVDRRRPERVRVHEAFELLLGGVFFKVVLADTVWAVSADRLNRVDDISSLTVTLSIAAVVIGGYFNILSYLYLALGSARLLGVRMQPNTVQPFTRSTSLTDFWRRMQVTVMAWFRDYVYQPLRGPRTAPEWRGDLALIVTFLLVGVWHGIQLQWVVWGIATALVLVVERRVPWLTHHRARQPGLRSALGAVGRRVYVMLLVMSMGLVASTDEVSADKILRALFGFRGGALDTELLGYVVAVIVALVLIDRRDRVLVHERDGEPDPVTVLRAVAFGVMVLLLVIYAGADAQPFVYSQF